MINDNTYMVLSLRKTQTIFTRLLIKCLHSIPLSHNISYLWKLPLWVDINDSQSRR